MTNIFKIIGAALVAGVLSVSALAGPMHHGSDGKNSERFMKKMTKKLDLSEEQQTAIKALKEQHVIDMGELRERKQTNREAIKASSAYDNYDAAAIAELAKESGDIGEQLVIMRAAHRHEFQALLTEEQRESLETAMEKRKDRKHRKREKRDK